MFDTHYDLLTILYCCYLKNDFSYIKKIKEELKEVRGIVANLYFMSRDEMKEELGIEEIDVYEMFKISTNLSKEHFPDKKIVFSIEGCDYIEDLKELENLYQLGLRNVLPVWNHKNKYGSGVKAKGGLTELGEEFIKKCVLLGISIDLSHMNEETFFDSVSLLEKLKIEGLNPKVIASHSNSYVLCSNKRNLNDEQILAIKKLGGMIGLVGYGPFIKEKEKDLEKNYLEHIQYIERLLGIDHISIATDNMDFATILFSIDEGVSLLNHKTSKKQLTKILSNYYNEEEIGKILFKNIETYFKE